MIVMIGRFNSPAYELVSAIHAIRKEAKSLPIPRSELEQMLGHGAYAILASINGDPVGYMLYTDSSRNVYIDDMLIVPGARHHGIGSLMMTVLTGSITDREAVVALVGEEEDEAFSFFQHAGFYVVGIEEGAVELHYPMDEGSRIIEDILKGNA